MIPAKMSGKRFARNYQDKKKNDKSIKKEDKMNFLRKIRKSASC